MSETYLELIENQPKSCFKHIIYLLSVPFLLFILIVAGYIGWVPFRVENHSVAMIGVIFIIYLFFLRHMPFMLPVNFCKKNLLLLKILIVTSKIIF